jgi:hypothetical protein
MKFVTLILFLFLSIFATSCGNNDHVSSSPNVIASSIVIAKNKVWQPGKKLIVTFTDGTENYKDQVKNYSNEWTQYANIDFVFYSHISEVPKNQTADIVISFSNRGDYSTVGNDSYTKIKTDKHSMNLERFKVGNRIQNRYVVLHEFGHALGLEHEHQNYNRKFVVDEKNAKIYCKSMAFTEQECLDFVIKKFEKNENTYFSVYDPYSVMHYDLHHSISVENINFRSNFTLSLIDKIEIAKLYPGRMSLEKIKETHQKNLDFLKEMTVYKNCKIEESVVQKIRLNTESKAELTNVKMYSVQSLNPGDISFNQIWEEKEAIVKFILEEPYCNYNEKELADFKAKLIAARKTKNKIGQCFIPLSEEEALVIQGCPKGSRFQVLQIDDHSSLDNICHLSFEDALKAMKKEEYCQLAENDIPEFEKQRLSKAKYNHCFIPMKPNGKAADSTCHKSFPWQVFSKLDEKSVIDSCFANFNEALSQMKSDSYCNLPIEKANAIEIQKKEAFELSRTKGKCYLENVSNLKSDNFNRCKSDYPWFINFNNSKALNNFCYSDHATPLKVMSEDASCQ